MSPSSPVAATQVPTRSNAQAIQFLYRFLEKLRTDVNYLQLNRKPQPLYMRDLRDCGPMSQVQDGDAPVFDAASGLFKPGHAGGYASLTGPGETVTPGDLTQLGGFRVDGGTTGAVVLQSAATGSIVTTTTSGGTNVLASGSIVLVADPGGNGIAIYDDSAVGVQIKSDGGPISLNTGGAVQLSTLDILSLDIDGSNGVFVTGNMPVYSWDPNLWFMSYTYVAPNMGAPQISPGPTNSGLMLPVLGATPITGEPTLGDGNQHAILFSSASGGTYGFVDVVSVSGGSSASAVSLSATAININSGIGTTAFARYRFSAETTAPVGGGGSLNYPLLEVSGSSTIFWTVAANATGLPSPGSGTGFAWFGFTEDGHIYFLPKIAFPSWQLVI